MRKFAFISTVLISGLLMTACEKEITIDLPEYEEKVVVDGRIEDGLPPIVFLSYSQEFFGTTDLAAFENSFVSGATVIVSNGTVTDTLDEICTQSLTPPMDTLVANFLGVDVSELALYNICAYVSLNPALFGEVGKTYTLTIKNAGDTYNSTTQIPELVPLDSIWFEEENPQTNPNYGFIWAKLTDPDTLGNGYRWYTRRLNTFLDTASGMRFEKDPTFETPFGSAFDDEFFNGLSFDFAYARASSDNDEPADRSGFFRVGDTIVVKYCMIDRAAVQFLTAAEVQASNNGSPFASPANSPTNITGGALGLWAGYGVTYDTTIATN